MVQLAFWKCSGGLASAEWPYINLFIIKPLSGSQAGDFAINNSPKSAAQSFASMLPRSITKLSDTRHICLPITSPILGQHVALS